MEKENYTVYAEFLAQCREMMGPLDLEKLAYDHNYKAELFRRLSLRADDQIFQIAALVNRQLEAAQAH